MIEKQILKLSLNNETYNKIAHLLKKDNFPKEVSTILDVVAQCHRDYARDITTEEVLAVHREKYPALTDTARKKVERDIVALDKIAIGDDIALDVIHSFWKRTKAKTIGEEALEIYLGNKKDVGGLLRNINELNENDTRISESYTLVEDGIEDLLKYVNEKPEFEFPPRIQPSIHGINRGNLGIIFARPEAGKTTFCAWLAANYISKGYKVAYWANEEIAKVVKTRIVLSYMRSSPAEAKEKMDEVKDKFVNEIRPNLYMLDSVGTSIQEIEEFTTRNEVDIVFIDQLDKVRIDAEFSRGDERLKELYCRAREIAKRNNVAVWAVSQANYEAHGRSEIDYSMLDSSRTGKAGEADIIIGIGVAEEENYRTIKVSKNKVNGWHGSIVMYMDRERVLYE